MTFVSFSRILNAQTPNLNWVKQFGGNLSNYTYNKGNSIKTDAFGNVYCFGDYSANIDFDPGPGTFTLAPGTGNSYLLKLDPSGNFIWAKAIGAGSFLYSENLAIDKSGDLYLTGSFGGFAGDFDPGPGIFNLTPTGGNMCAFVVKLSNSGNFIWAKHFEGNYVYSNSIAVDSVKNVYSTGFFQDYGDFNPGPGVFNLNTFLPIYIDGYISKLDSLGNFVWAKQIKGESYTYGNSICSDLSGNICVTGMFDSIVDFDPGPSTFTIAHNSGWDAYLLKLNSLGNFVFAKKFGGKGYERAKSVVIDGTDNIYSFGLFTDTCDFDPSASTYSLAPFGGTDTYILKLDPLGNFLWAKQLGGTGEDIAYDLCLDINSNVYTTGSFKGTADFDPGPGVFNLNSDPWSSIYNHDIFISKLDLNGSFLWAVQFGDTGADISHSIIVDVFNNVYTTGFFSSDTLDFDPIGTFTLTPINGQDIFIHKMCQSCPLSINEAYTTAKNSIFPNPTKDFININLNYQFIGGNIQLFDAIGKLIQTQPIKNTTEKLNLNLNSGIYFIKATTKDGVSKTEKLIVE